MNPTPYDVENGTTVTGPSATDNDNFTLGDESTLQAPPSMMEDHDLEDIDAGADDDGPSHDFPTPEEYKANMTSGSFRGSTTGNGSAVMSGGSGDVDENAPVHDLPTVEDYKSSRSFAVDGKQNNKKNRQGLWTFLILFALTALVTAIAVPLALKAQEEETSRGSSGSSANADDFSPAVPPPGTTNNPPPPTVSQPTAPGTVPPPAPTPIPAPGQSRFELAVNYLVATGVSSQAALQTLGSPQNNAAAWIANQDQFQIDIPTDLSQPHSRFTERYALAVLYFATGGPSWKYNLRFLQPVDHCDWYQDFVTTSGSIVRQGVSECMTLGEGFSDEFIHRLELSNNGLAGFLPEELSMIHQMTHFIMPFNAGITGNQSFMSIRSLSNLQHLELQYCSLTGSIPDYLGNLRALTSIGFGNNFLDGSLPPNFFMLSNLQLLGLDDNGFSGQIGEFGAFTKLESLYLEDNAFTGPLTTVEVAAWPNMIELDLSVNRLGGPIPADIWSMMNLEVLDLHGNGFEGPLPDITSLHPNLFFLALQDNELDFQIPEGITNFPNLAHLDISKNKFQLPFPSGMSQLTNLRYLFTGQNSFSEQPVPDFLAGMTALRELSMKDNNLTGPIPAFIGGLLRLQVLDLDQNMLTGAIPEELGQLTGIDTIMLNRNNLVGNIPASFALMNDLDLLLLDGNSITGTADVVCSNPTINLTHFVTDCGEPNPEITCSCCTLCCHDSNTTCNNFDWHVNLDPIWEYGYRRVVYSFSQNLLPDNSTNTTPP